MKVEDLQHDVLFAVTQPLPEAVGGALYAVGLIVSDYLLKLLPDGR